MIELEASKREPGQFEFGDRVKTNMNTTGTYIGRSGDTLLIYLDDYAGRGHNGVGRVAELIPKRDSSCRWFNIRSVKLLD